MLKLTELFEFPGENPISILSFTKAGGLEKRAAYCEIDKFCSSLSPKPGFTYLHILAMGAAEYWGHNRNCDSFPEDNLIKYHKTFETTPAMLYRNHVNKDPAKSYGKVIFSCYNDSMHRVELIVECRNDLVQDINREIAQGIYPATSMATKTPSDRCSICGNRARTRQEYCHHLRNELGKLYPDGRRVVAINDDTLIFFDISKVVRPADVTSSVLVKVANDINTGSAEIAEMYEIFDKTAALKKVSEIVKEIPGAVIGNVTDKVLNNTQDLPMPLARLMSKFGLDDCIQALAEAGISPSVGFLAELIATKKLGSGYTGVGELAEDLISGLDLSQMELPDITSLLTTGSPEDKFILLSALRPHYQSSSLHQEPVEKRASNIGYSGLGPHIEPTDYELGQKTEPSLHMTHNIELPSILKLLLTVGLFGLAAKSYLTSKIKEKNSLTNDNNQVKIILVKSAGVSYELAQASLYKSAGILTNVPVQNIPKNSGHNSDASNLSPSSVVERMLKKAIKNYAVRSVGTTFGEKLSSLFKAVKLGSAVV